MSRPSKKFAPRLQGSVIRAHSFSSFSFIKASMGANLAIKVLVKCRVSCFSIGTLFNSLAGGRGKTSVLQLLITPACKN